MSVQTQIDRISDNVSAALSAIEAKGAAVPVGSTSDDLANLILTIGAKVTVSTTDLTAGSSALPSGEVYLVYE